MTVKRSYGGCLAANLPYRVEFSQRVGWVEALAETHKIIRLYDGFHFVLYKSRCSTHPTVLDSQCCKSPGFRKLHPGYLLFDYTHSS